MAEERIDCMEGKNDPRYYYVAQIMYVITTIFHLTMIVVPNFRSNLFKSLAENIHILVPSSYVLILWPVIFIWISACIFIGCHSFGSDRMVVSYKKLVASRYVELFLYHLVIVMLWGREFHLFIMIISFIYLKKLIELMKLISSSSVLRDNVWILKYPVGLHTGWLLVVSLVSFYAYLMSLGFAPVGLGMLLTGIGVLLSILSFACYLFIMYGNHMIMIAPLFYFFGLLTQHYPGSNFTLRHPIFYMVVALIFLLAVALYIRLLRYQRK